MNITSELKDRYQSLIDKGYTTKQIANELKICWSTVKGHLRKLELKTIHKIDPRPIEKFTLEELIKQNLSTYDIADKLFRSQGSVKHWIKKYKLKTHATNHYGNLTRGYKEGDEKTCPKCQRKLIIDKKTFYIKSNGNIHAWCKECNDKITHQKQLKRKNQCVEYKGGKCSVCGYDKYIGALDFHHINPKEKEFNIANLRTYSWESLKKELDKCICICKNCHAELHNDIYMSTKVVVGRESNPG